MTTRDRGVVAEPLECCQGRMLDDMGHRVAPCHRAPVARVRGTHGLTADLCATHARSAIDRPRLVRDWLLQEREETVGAGAPGPGRGVAAEGIHGPPDLNLRLTADLAALDMVRGSLATDLARRGWPADLLPFVILASSEAVANAIEHGSPPDGEIVVALTVGPHEAEISVTDAGRLGAAVPLATPALPASDRVRGRGFVVMARLAEEVHVTSDGRGTTIRLVFAREPAGD